LELHHLSVLGFCVQQDRPDSFSLNSGFCRLIEDCLKLSFRNILSSQASDKGTERPRPQRLVIQTGCNLLKENASLPWRQILIQDSHGPAAL
jgi:hypothetical protein